MRRSISLAELAVCGEGERQEGNPAATSREDLVAGASPWRAENPMDVTGMKQGRASERGESRREGEKP
jgi:hypothetical protein